MIHLNYNIHQIVNSLRCRGLSLSVRAALIVPVLLASTGIPAVQPKVAAAASPVRILTIGDSITAAGKWQTEFGRLLTQAGVPNVIETEAVGGTRCDYWIPRIKAILDAHQPDLVVLACGTNDDVNSKTYGESSTGYALRYITEAIHGYRPSNPIKVLPALIQYSDPLVAPDWLLSSEPQTNDTLYRNMQYYPIGSWLAGIANFQVIPATATYLDDGGVHPTDRGYRYMGRLVYNASYAVMGWPATTEAPLCDLYGHRKGYARPTYIPCP
ncbi:MAG TPA: SGNH/GDSL hydrolase family protein [Patescibacteria group bacterium]|nr:SGNH/GDSL hydrolase family protein [Patescibacteria group bacterium]